MESTPHIRTFIKYLRLVEIHKPWIQRSEELRRILDLLSPYVVSLNIHQRRRKPENSRFDYSSLSQLTCIQEILLGEEMMSGVSSFADGDNALPMFLNQFPTLKALTFDQCWVRNRTIDSKSDVAAPVFRLEMLDVCYCDDTLVLDWLIPAIPSLQKLHISYPVPDPSNFSTTVSQIIIASGKLLQHIEVRALENASNAGQLFLFSCSYRVINPVIV